MGWTVTFAERVCALNHGVGIVRPLTLTLALSLKGEGKGAQALGRSKARGGSPR